MSHPDAVISPISPPFVVIEGVVNIRSIGGCPMPSRGVFLKSPALFRSGEPSGITPRGMDQLLALGIRRVFDFRSDVEIAGYKTATPAIEGVEFVRVPVSKVQAYDPVSLAPRLKSFETNEIDAFVELYTEFLTSGGPAFEVILRYLIDNPTELCLVHCTAGKDRTGVFVALLLMILGVDDEYIIHDYCLTTMGLAPALPSIISRFRKHESFRNNQQGLINLVGAKRETMIATLNMIREKFGGADGYLRTYTNLTDANIRKIRQSLLSGTAQSHSGLSVA